MGVKRGPATVNWPGGGRAPRAGPARGGFPGGRARSSLRAMNTGTDSDAAARAAWLAALAFQAEGGADEAVAETPQDRFAEEAARRAAVPAAPPAADAPPPDGRARPPAPRPPAGGAPAAGQGTGTDKAAGPGAETAEQAARAAAARCADLEALVEAIRGFERCPLKKGARNTVIRDGRPGARVMVIGEAPGKDEDREGRPFVGRSGRLLDRMLGAVGLARDAQDPAAGAYITNVVYWRPIENRRPSGDEVAMLAPFLERHIELAAPDFVLLMGAAPAQALLETTTGITRLRGTWRRWRGLPVLPSFHPAYLLRQPEKKREAWRDLLALRAALDGAPIPEASR
jgi:DNA polymerase